MIQLWPDCGLVYLVWLGTGHYYGKRGVYKTRGLGGGQVKFYLYKKGSGKGFIHAEREGGGGAKCFHP